MRPLVRHLIYFGAMVFAGLLLAGVSKAQALPNHFDPSAREQLPDLAAVPAIRFLTTTDFPPFNFRDASGELVGFHIDLARAICDELSIVCTVQSWPWAQAKDALAGNQGDALISGVALNADTAEQFGFSSVYLSFPARFVVRRADENAFDPDNANGAVISARTGGKHAAFIQKFLPDAILRESKTEIEALQALADGTADAYFGDALRASFWLNANSECCEFSGDAYFRPDYFGEGLAIAVPKGRDAVRTAIDVALARLQKKGKFDELYLRWFPISFY